MFSKKMFRLKKSWSGFKTVTFTVLPILMRSEYIIDSANVYLLQCIKISFKRPPSRWKRYSSYVFSRFHFCPLWSRLRQIREKYEIVCNTWTTRAWPRGRRYGFPQLGLQLHSQPRVGYFYPFSHWPWEPFKRFFFFIMYFRYNIRVKKGSQS